MTQRQNYCNPLGRNQLSIVYLFIQVQMQAVCVSLYLRLLPARRRLVDGHLDGLLPVGHHDRPQRRVVRVHLLVVHRPEAVEDQVLLVPT